MVPGMPNVRFYCLILFLFRLILYVPQININEVILMLARPVSFRKFL